MIMNASHSPSSLPNVLRRRHVPERFSWLDHRLLLHGHLAACSSTDALALYLVLCVAADSKGLSYYSERRLGAILALDTGQLRTARRNLIEHDLIAWRHPHYQVLCLDPECLRQERLRRPEAREAKERTAQTLTLREALEAISRAASKDHD